MADISDDEPKTDISPEELSQDLKDRNQERRFRSLAFYVIGLFTIAFLLGLLYWLVYFPANNISELLQKPDDLKKYADLISHAKIFLIIGILILASIPTTLALALLRFAFSSKNNSNAGKDLPNIWFSFAKECLEVIKKYLSKK